MVEVEEISKIKAELLLMMENKATVRGLPTLIINQFPESYIMSHSPSQMLGYLCFILKLDYSVLSKMTIFMNNFRLMYWRKSSRLKKRNPTPPLQTNLFRDSDDPLSNYELAKPGSKKNISSTDIVIGD